MSVFQASQHIGNVGNSGTTRGAGPNDRSPGHLHFDVNNRANAETVASNSVNPQRFFPYINFTGDLSNVRP